MTRSREAKRAAKRARKAARPRFTWRERGVRMALATLAGVCIFLSFPFSTEPDSNWWPLAWIGLVPFFMALQGASGRQGFWIGAWCGLVTNFGGFWWVSEVLHDFGHLPSGVVWPITVLNAFYQGLSFAIFGLCYSRAAKWYVRPEVQGAAAVQGARLAPERPPIWMTAALFTAVEWLYPLLFPWFLANGQYRFLPAIQIAELGGVPLATFVMVAFNAALHALLAWRMRRERLPVRAVALTFAGVAATLVYGVVRIAAVDDAIAAAPKVRLGLVEANIGIFEKQAKHVTQRAEQDRILQRNLLLHQKMSSELVAQGVDLVIWPESSFFPVRYPFIKRQDDFALGVTADGRAYALRYANGTKAPTWVEVPLLARAPLGEGLVAAARAVAAAREDGWAVAGDGGVIQLGTRTWIVPGTPNLTALAVVESAGYAQAQDEAALAVWAVGEHGTLVKLPPTRGGEGAGAVSVTTIPSGTDARLNAIAMASSHDGVAVGDGGTLLEITRDVVTKVDTRTTANLYAVFTSGPGSAIAVGARGTVLVRRTPGTWEPVSPGTQSDLRAMAVSPQGALWVGGAGGVVFTPAPVDGGWAAQPLPTKSDIVAMASDGLGQPLAATADGKVYRIARGAAAWEALPVPPAAMVALAPLGFASTFPLPRTIRWVWQGDAPLPALEAYDAKPAIELDGVAERDLNAIQRGFRAPLLLGGLTWEDAPPGEDPDGDGVRMFNTAILLDEEGHVRGTYDKNFLLAFGEFMPFGSLFPGLYKVFKQAGRFTAGSEVRVFGWRGFKIGIMICYEDIMPNFTGKLADLEPNIIINVTNDAWFGRTAEPHHHLALSVFRAIENRLMLVRSTNTGISAFIDPTGRITGQTRIDGAETLVSEAPMMAGGTLFGAVGNLFAMLCFLGVLVPAIVRIVRRVRAWWATRAAARA